MQRIENLLTTTYNENSQTNKINDIAGIAPVKVDVEVFNLIEREEKELAFQKGVENISIG